MSKNKNGLDFGQINLFLIEKMNHVCIIGFFNESQHILASTQHLNIESHFSKQ
jgi:hypothetical protein